MVALVFADVHKVGEFACGLVACSQEVKYNLMVLEEHMVSRILVVVCIQEQEDTLLVCTQLVEEY